MASKDKPNAAASNGDEMQEVKDIINAEVASLRPSELAVLELLTWLEEVATEDTEDTGAGFFGDDIARILMAPDEATMMEADELPKYNAKVLSGSELDVYGFVVKFSNSAEIESGLIGPKSKRKMFLLVRSARLSTAQKNRQYRLPEVGEEFVWNTSARFIVAKLYWYQRHGRFDNGGSVKLRIQGTDLDGGKSVEKLKSLDVPAMAGQAEQPPF